MVAEEEGTEGEKTEERKERKGDGEESRRGRWGGAVGGNCRVFWAGLMDEGAARVGGGGVVS